MIEFYKAVVQGVFPKGKHGPYAIASSKEVKGRITFSLTEAWEEDEFPEPGHFVILSGLTKKRAGWRAQHARFFKPEDEERAVK